MKKKKKKSNKHTEVSRFKTKKSKKKTSKKKKKRIKQKLAFGGSIKNSCYAYFDKVGVDPVIGKTIKISKRTKDAHKEGCYRAARAAKPDSTFGAAYYSYMRTKYKQDHHMPPVAEAKARHKKVKKSKKKKTKKS